MGFVFVTRDRQRACVEAIVLLLNDSGGNIRRVRCRGPGRGALIVRSNRSRTQAHDPWKRFLIKFQGNPTEKQPCDRKNAPLTWLRKCLAIYPRLYRGLFSFAVFGIKTERKSSFWMPYRQPRALRKNGLAMENKMSPLRFVAISFYERRIKITANKSFKCSIGIL